MRATPKFGWKLRLALGLQILLTRLRLMPTTTKVSQWPTARRKALKPPAWMTHPMPMSVSTAREMIATPDGPMELKWFRTSAAQAPSILFIHGGGWVVGGVDSLDYLCSNLCERLGVAVVAVDYRLAPDHRFPAALEDCYAALNWLATKTTGPLLVVGDSAGGNLSAALCLLARERGGPAIAHQTLIYPSLDATLSSPSLAYDLGGVKVADLASALRLYLGDHNPRDPLVSPMFAADHRGLPPAFIVTADGDPLRDDGPLYAERLRAAGVPVRYVNYPDMPHGFLSQPKLCPGAAGALADIVEEMRPHLRPQTES